MKKILLIEDNKGITEGLLATDVSTMEAVQ